MDQKLTRPVGVGQPKLFTGWPVSGSVDQGAAVQASLPMRIQPVSKRR